MTHIVLYDLECCGAPVVAAGDDDLQRQILDHACAGPLDAPDADDDRLPRSGGLRIRDYAWEM